MAPGAGFAQLAERFHGQRDQPQRFARRIEAPARHGHHAVVGEVREVIAKGVGGVEIVLGKREGAGRGGRPGIHQGGLQHLVLVGAAAHEAAAVLDENVDVGAQVETAAEPGEALAHDGGGDDGIDLDSGDVVAAGSQRARHVPAAAGPDDQSLGARPDGIGKAGALLEQVAAVARREVVEIEIGDGGGGVGIDEDGVPAFIGVVHNGHARKVVPLDEPLVGQRLALGVADVDAPGGAGCR